MVVRLIYSSRNFYFINFYIKFIEKMNADQNQNGLPPWMQAEKISIRERLEITSYKVITYIPVAVTMGLFTFLFAYYSFVSTNLVRERLPLQIIWINFIS